MEEAFLECGGYSKKISKIANKILEERRLSGENITKKEIEELQSYINQAYQIILNNVNTFGVSNAGVVISNSINSLSDIIDQKGDISGIIATADQISKQEIVKDFEEKLNKKDSNISVGTIRMGGLISGLSQESMLITQKLFSIELQNQIAMLYASAKMGNLNDTANISEIEGVSKIVLQHPELDEKSRRALYASMMRLGSLKSEVTNQTLENIADNYKIDIYKMDENGKRSIDLLKLQDMYQESVREVNPKAAEKTLEDFRKMSIKRAKIKVEQKVYNEDSAKDIVSFEKAYEARIEYNKYLRGINKKYREGDIEGLEELMKSSPEYAIQAVKDILSWQQNPIKTSRKNQLMQQGLIMGNILTSIKKEKDNTTIENLTEGINMFEIQQKGKSEVDDYEL